MEANSMLYELHEKVLRLEREGKRVIDLTFGDPDLPTDPRITEATIAALRKGESHHESSAGMPELREALAERHGVDAEQVVVMPGSKMALYGLFSTLLKPGDKVAVPTPHWTAIPMLAKERGAIPVLLRTEREERWQPTLEQLERAVAEGARMVLLTTPGNPTSTMASKELMDGVVELCARKKVWLVTDECYADLAFTECPSAIGKGIVLKSFSKTFSLPGYRIGYTVTDAAVAKELTAFNARTITSMPEFIQLGAVRAVGIWDEVARKARAVYEQRATAALKALRGSGLRVADPDAAFYLFPEFEGDGVTLASTLLDDGVAVTPGVAFGEFPKCFRISLTAPEMELAEAMKKITAAVR